MSETPDVPTRPETGVRFVARDGRRSSTTAGRAVFSDAVAAVDPDLSKTIAATKDWRKQYLGAVRDVVAAGGRDAKNALRIASDGLSSVRENLTFATNDGELTLPEAFRTIVQPELQTAVVQGDGEADVELAVPYRGEELRGDELLRRIERWEDAGTLEPSAAEALRAVVRTPEWLDLSDHTVTLLGASSQMGPLEMLSRWRANIVAVDLPRPHLWDDVVTLVRNGRGRARIPVTKPVQTDDEIAANAGVDLLEEGPRTRDWLATFEGPMTIGNYVYADGSTFVRVASAADALIADLVERRDDISLAYLATPTDVFAVPEEVVAASEAARRGRWSVAGRFIRPLTAGKTFDRNYRELIECSDGRRWGIADSLVPIQGPNYALAKSLQRWRAIAAREQGRLSSANVAPSTRTMSVIKNRMLAAAYRGAGAFGVDIFDPPTSRAVMAALLVHDLRNPAAPANPGAELAHPFDLFAHGAVHGGIWRLGYEPRSILPLALLLGLTKRH